MPYTGTIQAPVTASVTPSAGPSPSAVVNPTTGKSNAQVLADSTAAAQKAAAAIGGSYSPTTGYAASKPPMEPTVLSSSNIDQKNTDNVTKAGAAAQKPTGQTSENGFVLNADRSFADAPSDAKEITDDSGSTYWQQNGMNYAVGPSNGQVSSDPYTQSIFDQFKTLKGSMDANGAAQIAAIQGEYTALTAQQQKVNAGSEANTSSLLTRGGSNQTASASGILQSQVSYGIQQISTLNAAEADAISKAQDAVQQNDMKLLDSMLSIADKARTEKQAAAQKLADTVTAAKQQAFKDSTIASFLEQGITNPADILSELKKQGVTNISSSDIASTLKNLNPDQQQIYSLMQTAEENGAPKDVLAALSKSRSFTDALTAGATWISSNADVQQYNMYRSQAMTAGQTPVSFDSWQGNKKYMDAYNAARGDAAGKVAGASSGGSTATISSKDDLPQALKPYGKQSASGVWYLDLSGVGAAQRAALINQAGDMPVLTDKNQAADLVNIKDAASKLHTIESVMTNLNSPSALSRALGGAGLTALSAMAQTNPKAAAASALNDSALDFLKALSGVQGFRGNAAAIAQIKDSLPKSTDTQDVAAQKLQYIAQQIQDREDATLGQGGPVDYTQFTIRTEQQSQDALSAAGKKDTAVQSQITQVLNETNPDTGQTYTYTEAAQILGISIAASADTAADGTQLFPNIWREMGLTN